MPNLHPSSGDDPDHRAQVKTINNPALTIPHDTSLYHDGTTIAFANSNLSFEVDKAFICQSSRFFAMAFNNPMKESYENKIELQDVKPNTVRKFLDYLNNKNILLYTKIDADAFIDMVELYKFADFVDVHRLCNNITSIAHDWFKTMYELPFEMDYIKAMVKYLPPHSGLRKLLIAAVVSSLDSRYREKYEFEIHEHYPPDLSDAILRGGKISITSHPQCDFHEHRSWEECELCGEFRDGQFMPPFSAGPSEGW